MALNLQQLGDSLGQALQGIGTYSAQAANQANAVSAQAQSAQGAFNQASANQANMINDQSMQAQYGFNSAMMNNANQFTADMWNQAAAYNEAQWDKAADFNREMWQKTADYNTDIFTKTLNFNRQEAINNRAWTAGRDDTKYQRAVADMSKAGLNPILAVMNGGVSAGVPGGQAASVGGSGIGTTSMSPSTMSSAQGQMAQGGLLGSHSAQESNYMGQMEYLSGTLGLISAVIGGLSSAADAAGPLGNAGQEILQNATEILNPEDGLKKAWETAKKGNPLMQNVEDAYNWVKDKWNKYGPNKAITNKHSERDQYLRQNDINKSWDKYWKPKG